MAKLPSLRSSPGAAGFPFFFQNKNIQKHQKSRSRVTPVRIERLRINDCPSEPPARKEGLLLCLQRFPAQAQTLQTRIAARQHRPPSSEPCRFRAASQQCRSNRCFGLRKQLQELVRLIRPPLPREPPNARVHLLQTTLGNFVPSSGEQPSMKTHHVTLHLFWLCHPFPGDKPESCRSQVVRRDNPSTTTFKRRASLTLNQVTSRSQTMTFVEPRPLLKRCADS